MPQFLFLLAAVAAGLALFILAVRREGVGRAILQVLRLPALPVLAFTSGVIVVLSSTLNQGDGFIAPAVPALLVLACLAFQTLSRSVLSCGGLIGMACLVACLSVLPTTGLPAFGRPMIVMLPAFGTASLTFGAGTIQHYETNGRYFEGDWNWPVPRAEGRAFAAIYEQAARRLSGQSVAFGVRGFLFNVNMISLYQRLLGFEPARAMTQVDPITIGGTSQGVTKWLTQGQASAMCLLVVSNGVKHQFQPFVPPDVMEAGAVAAGFSNTGTKWVLPGGERITLWRRAGCG
ncbi:hypothetical protein [Acidocella sp.]|uniref:hypothetical protein n=1 Tax=Acidocella sp. TaxID=50710 RepID=UPI003D01B321